MLKIRNILLISAIIFFIISSSGCEKDNIIKIGVAGPHSGDQAQSGISSKNAVMLAADNINEAGGILGKKIQIIAEDDVCKPEVAVNVASKLVSEGVVAVIGHICDDATAAALEVYNKNDIPLVSPSSTNSDLTLQNKDGFFFRTSPHDKAQAAILTKFIAGKQKASKVAIISDGGEKSRHLANLVGRELSSKGVLVVYRTEVKPGSDDYSGLISNLKNTAPDVVFYAGYYPEGTKLVIQIRKSNLHSVFISGDGLKDPSFLETAGKHAEGCYVSSTADISHNPAALAINKKLEARGQEPGTFGLQAHAGATAVFSAISKAQSIRGREIAGTLRTNKVSTALGTISFDQYGDITGSGYSVFQVVNGTFEPITW